MLIVTHGWPGSIVEQMKVIDLLANPTAHGANASDAFDIVIPSMLGYGFSGKPTRTGWDPAHIARPWDLLMKRLGCDRYVAQGGDWGAIIVDQMGVQAPSGLIGIHTNMPGIFPAGHRRGGLLARRRHRVCRPTRNSGFTSVCNSSIRRESPTDSKWGCDRRALYGIAGFTRRPGSVFS